jgi:hypothetical protein
MMLVSSMLLVPTMAMGIAQQEQDPATGQQLQGQQNLNQQGQMPQSGESMHGVIVEIRDDSFSLRTDEKGVVWFTLTPEMKTQHSAELVTGNHVEVWSSPGDSPDRMNATRIARYAGADAAATDTTADPAARESAVAEADADVDVDVDADTDAAEFETDAELETAQVAEAETESEFQDDTTEFDTDSERSELPRTASSLPALGAVGLLALLGAAVVAIARRF